jgi:uncharacterized membrane-anchored protein YjiN (DUF445 family)
MITLSQEQIDNIIENAKPDIINSLKTEAVKTITTNFNYAASNLITEAVKKWTAEEVIPEILSSLTESKDGLIQVGVKAGTEIVEEFAKAMTMQIKESMESSWKRQNLIKTLMGLS